MRPGVIADLKTHLVDLADFFPSHEVVMIIHPAMTHKKGGPEPKVFQKWGHKRSVGLGGIIKGQDNKFGRDSDRVHR